MDGQTVCIRRDLPELLVEMTAIHHADGRVSTHQPTKNIFRTISAVGVDALEGVPDIWIATAWHHRNPRGVILGILHVAVRGEDGHAIAVCVENGLGPHHFPRWDITLQVQPKEIPTSSAEDLGVAHPTWRTPQEIRFIFPLGWAVAFGKKLWDVRIIPSAVRLDVMIAGGDTPRNVGGIQQVQSGLGILPLVQLITTIHHVSVVRYKLNIPYRFLLGYPLGLGTEDLRKRLAVVLCIRNANHSERLGKGYRQELKHHDTIMVHFCSECMCTKIPRRWRGIVENAMLWSCLTGKHHRPTGESSDR